MNSFFRSLKSITLVYLTIILLNLQSTYSQLTENDMNYMKNFINAQKDEKTGVFSTDNDMTNLMSVESLNILGFTYDKKSFCRELEFSKEDPSYAKLELNEITKCGVQFSFAPEKNVNEKYFEILESNSANIFEFWYNLSTFRKLNVEMKYEQIYTKVKDFKTKMMLYSTTEGSDKASLSASSIALRIFSLIARENKDLLPEVIPEMRSILQELDAHFESLGNNISTYSENDMSTFTLNRLMLEAFTDMKNLTSAQISVFEDEYFDSRSYKLLNYFLKFKHNIVSLESIYSLTKSLDILKSWPVMKITKNTIFLNEEETDEKMIPFVVMNVFGREMSNLDININYQLKDDEAFNVVDRQSSRGRKSEDSTDLEEDESIDLNLNEEVDKLEEERLIEKKITLKNVSGGQLNFENIMEVGKYTYDLNAEIINNSANGLKVNIAQEFLLRAITKLKISYLKVSVSNTSDKNDSKESKVDFPKRSFRNIKATQNSLVKLKIKLNTVSNKLEQFFLRLKHNELNKLATGFSSEYNAAEGYHIITLDLSDHSVIEAYDGIYEMSILITDPGMENPILWNFGKIEMKFNKPLDPLSIGDDHKNIIKPKLEHTFAPEQHAKTSLAAPIFSAIIILVTLIYMKYLKSNGINFENFPRADKSLQIISFLFVFIVIFYAYLLFLFWIRLNIVQTIFILIVTSVPASIVVFKTITTVEIEI